MATNLEYLGISLNMEKLRNYRGILCNLREKFHWTSWASNEQSREFLTWSECGGHRRWPVILLELMWNDPWWRSLLHLLSVAITYGKVSLWLWKSLENSGNFFLLLYGHPGNCQWIIGWWFTLHYKPFVPTALFFLSSNHRSFIFLHRLFSTVFIYGCAW